ncbi:phage head closure protein [Sphingomonas sp. ID0503]|uniref:phage head closure protein n=1 Tax=Sphingomonas sp. ID0503 TaxID=3399691 RepID=UPI003AFB5E17
MGVIEAGTLNRRVRIERKVSASGFMSAGKETWEPVATVRASVQDMLPSRAERIAEGVNIAARPARIRMWYRDDVTADMRIVIGERILQIVAGPAELGNREGIEIVAEDYSTSGGVA